MPNYKGYQEDFLGEEHIVELPFISEGLKENIASVKGTDDHILRYPNYSVIQSATRRLPIISAANINGNLFQSITRKEVGGSWRKDRRIKMEHQWGSELYKATLSDFDKGHMTKREDVQWASNKTNAALAAKETFYYTNAVPQHKNLNQVIWRKIEDYILHDETIDEQLKINVFTGPVLSEMDPYFVTEVRGSRIQIPTLFWKVIYYVKQGILHQVCFLVGQAGVLQRTGITEPSPVAPRGGFSPFSDFEDAETYQVEIGLLEKLTGLGFPFAIDAFEDPRPQKLILQEVTLRGEGKVVRFVEGLVV